MNSFKLNNLVVRRKANTTLINIDYIKMSQSKTTCEFVECDICNMKNINPDDLDEGDLNLSLIGKGYAHEYCMSEDQKEKYEESLKL